MQEMTSKLKLTVNEAKTHVCQVPEESFDFLGYTFGRCYSPKTGRAYIGTRPSKKRIARMCDAISEMTGRDQTLLDAQTLVGKLNRTMAGWANYFCLGPVSKAYRAVDQHARKRLRQWLCQAQNTVAGDPTVPRINRCTMSWVWSAYRSRPPISRGRTREVLLREPDAGNPHVRFDEREVETEHG